MMDPGSGINIHDSFLPNLTTTLQQQINNNNNNNGGGGGFHFFDGDEGYDNEDRFGPNDNNLNPNSSIFPTLASFVYAAAAAQQTNQHQQPQEGTNETLDAIPLTLVSILVAVLTITTLAGNVLVCLAVILVRKLRQPENYLFVSLAVSDFFVGCFVMPLAYAYLIFGKWNFGELACSFWTSADVTLCTASILNLCAISVDKYLAISKALKYQRRSRTILLAIGLVWIAALLISIVPIFAFRERSAASLRKGKCIVTQNVYYQICATLLSFFFPLFIMLLVNYKVLQAARRMEHADAETSSQIYGGGSVTNNVNSRSSRANSGSRAGSLPNTHHKTFINNGGGRILLVTSAALSSLRRGRHTAGGSSDEGGGQNAAAVATRRINKINQHKQTNDCCRMKNQNPANEQPKIQNSMVAGLNDDKSRAAGTAAVFTDINNAAARTSAGGGSVVKVAAAGGGGTMAVVGGGGTMAIVSVIQSSQQPEEPLSQSSSMTKGEVTTTTTTTTTDNNNDGKSQRNTSSNNSNNTTNGTSTASQTVTTTSTTTEPSPPSNKRHLPQGIDVDSPQNTLAHFHGGDDNMTTIDNDDNVLIDDTDELSVMMMVTNNTCSSSTSDSHQLMNNNGGNNNHGGDSLSNSAMVKRRQQQSQSHQTAMLMPQIPLLRRVKTAFSRQRQQSNTSFGGGPPNNIFRPEGKALKTLGIIMGAFITCWLPFFILAFVRPLFCAGSCTWIPPWLDWFVLWLGYFNSTLNPLIYAKYNRDFRILFREMLCCRFGTLENVMRLEMYAEKFGIPESSVCNNHNSYNNKNHNNSLSSYDHHRQSNLQPVGTGNAGGRKASNSILQPDPSSTAAGYFGGGEVTPPDNKSSMFGKTANIIINNTPV